MSTKTAPMTRAEILALLKKRGGNEATVMHAYLSVSDDERKARREAALKAWRERGCLPDSDPVGPFATELEALTDACRCEDDA